MLSFLKISTIHKFREKKYFPRQGVGFFFLANKQNYLTDPFALRSIDRRCNQVRSKVNT